MLGWLVGGGKKKECWLAPKKAQAEPKGEASSQFFSPLSLALAHSLSEGARRACPERRVAVVTSTKVTRRGNSDGRPARNHQWGGVPRLAPIGHPYIFVGGAGSPPHAIQSRVCVVYPRNAPRFPVCVRCACVFSSRVARF